jgi:TonB family protein
MTPQDRDGRPSTRAIEGLDFSQGSSGGTPPHRGVTVSVYVAAFIVHAIVVFVLVRAQRFEVAGAATNESPQHGIAAFQVPAPTSTSGISAPAVKETSPARLARPRQKESASSTQNAESVGSGQTGASSSTQGVTPGTPVRLGSNLGLIKKVNPVFPRSMEAARAEGTVVLDAIIHRDGSVGDIKVLRSSAPAFEQAAIDAVKQWRYTPLPYEGIVTVTVHFTLPR